MDNLEHMTPGDVLQQADLASYVGAMAIGVAEAQRALDDNTINQLVEFLKPQPGLSGQSLLQVGLMPAFYAFRSATLSCSVSMTLKVSQSFNAGITVGTGTSTTSTTKIISGSTKISNFSDVINVSQSTQIKASSNTEGMTAIESYAANNQSNSECAVLAERLAVTDAASYSTATNGLARYSSASALFVVPAAKGLRWTVIAIEADPAAGDTFNLLASGTYTVPSGMTTRPALATALLNSVTTGQPVTGFILSKDGLDQLGKTLFAIDSYAVATIAGANYAERLRALAAIVQAGSLSIAAITGHTDATGPAGYNLRLSQLRAKAVSEVLSANGVAGLPASTGVGEQGVPPNGGSDQTFRRVDVDVSLPANAYYLYLEETTPGALAALPAPAAQASANGYAATGVYPSTCNVTKGSTNFAAVNAADLVAQINADSFRTVEATQEGELVYLTNKSSSSAAVAKVSIYAKTTSGFTKDTSKTWDESVAATSNESNVARSEQTVNRSSAVVGSLDARFARMFDLSLSGNMSLAAELVNVPAPPEFLKFVRDNLGQGDGH